MSMLEDLLAQAGGNLDISALAGMAGLETGEVQGALGKLLPQIADPTVNNGVAVADVAGKTGIDAGSLAMLLPLLMKALQGTGGSGGVIDQVMTGLGGSSAGAGGMMGQVAGMLDRDGDGNPLNDIMGMFGKK